jgi:hypothetical protein
MVMHCACRDARLSGDHLRCSRRVTVALKQLGGGIEHATAQSYGIICPSVCGELPFHMLYNEPIDSNRSTGLLCGEEEIGIMGYALVTLMGLGIATAGAAIAAATPPEDGHTVLELRQYKIAHGQRDIFIPFFEREFVETQEALGMRLVGQFRERDDPDRFVWLREFPNMTQREKQLSDFYYGPVWKAHRDQANPMLDDNDNVLLLKPVSPDDDFRASSTPRAKIGEMAPPHGVVIAHILYLWKVPDSGFAAFFDAKIKPALNGAGLPVLGVFVPESAPNNFPRLQIRQGEKLLVWFTRTANQVAYDAAWRKVTSTFAWKRDIAPTLSDSLERPPQILHLDPTPRSALR